MEKHAQLITRLASVGFVLVFVALVLSTVWGATMMRRATARTLAAFTLSERYELLVRQLAVEASLVRMHGFDPDGAGLNEERPAAIATESTLEAIANIGSAQDRATVRATMADHDHFFDVLLELYSKIDDGAANLAGTFNRSLQISNRMSERLGAQVAVQHHIAVTSLAELDRTQSLIARTIFAASVLGFGLLSLCLFVIATYRHSLEKVRRCEIDRLALASLTDTLTGLGNHRSYQDDVAREIAALSRHGNCLTLALIDIDNFKSVNDCFGHIQGDTVLAALGKLLQDLRGSDRSYRLGGDEFAVILPFTSGSEALTVMERLRQSAPAALHGSTLSIGLASTSNVNVDPLRLRSQADAALYNAKRLGRDNVVLHVESTDVAYAAVDTSVSVVP